MDYQEKWDPVLINPNINPIYVGQKNENFLYIQPSSKGSRGEKIVSEIMDSLGHKVEPRGRLANGKANTQHDRIINYINSEIKTSTLWTGVNTFKFQQIEMEYDFEDLYLLCILPNETYLFKTTKEEIKPFLTPQHSENCLWGTFSLEQLRENFEEI